jgi:antitoxin PrlF
VGGEQTRDLAHRTASRTRCGIYLGVLYWINEAAMRAVTSNDWQSYIRLTHHMLPATMPIATVGRRGQTTVPREIREQLDLKEGDRLLFLVREGEVVVRCLRETLLDLVGSVPQYGQTDSEGIRKDVMDWVARGYEDE